MARRAKVPPRTPKDEARAIVTDLRTELAWGSVFSRIVAELPPEDRDVLRRVVRTARDARLAAASATEL